MIQIDVEEFKRLRRSVFNVRSLGIPGYPRGMLFTILSQKKVDSVKKFYPEAIKKLDDIASKWKNEKKLPEWLRLTPVMRVRLLLKAMGISRAATNRILNDPEKVYSEVDSSFHPEELEKMIWKALYTDYVYSPLAARHQRARGKLGEEIVLEWLREKGIDFYTENDLRNRFSKTPDFFFEEPVRFNGAEVRWVESKALFGDPKTHQIYSRKQFSAYREMFGDGYIVYWFGHVRGIDDNVLETSIFHSQLKNALNDMIVYTAGGSRKKVLSLAEKLKAHVVDVGIDIEANNCTRIEVGNEVNSREFLDGVGKIIDCYSKGRLIVADSSKNWKESIRKDIGWILRNMGFAVVHV